jgi:hypothetical protein
MTRAQFDNVAVEALARGVRPIANTLLPFYRSYPYRGGLWLSEIDLRVAICPEYRFVYSRLPKNANSTLTAALAGAAGRAGGGSAKHVFLRPSRVPRSMVREMQDWLWVVFVRNPFSRVLSAYLDKIAHRKRQANRLMRMTGGAVPDFEGFCRYLDDGGLLDDNHWAPQVEGLIRRPEDYGFIGRFESLEADYRALHERLFGFTPGPLRQSGPVATSASHRLRQAYTGAAQDIVRRLYARDFESFGYPTELPE